MPGPSLFPGLPTGRLLAFCMCAVQHPRSMSVAIPRTRRDDLTAAGRPLAAAIAAGFLAGVVVGGIGGRLAMLVLRLTSDPSLHGLKTDDDFTIGIVSGATLFLLLLTATTGVFGGVVYVVVRSWLPRGARPWIFGALIGIVGGAIVIRPGGVDFTLLDPLPLAVAMFIALPAAYGIVVSLLTERFLLRWQPGGWRDWIGALVLLPILLLLLRSGPIGLAVSAAVFAVFAATRVVPQIRSLWTSAPTVWIVRAALAAVAVLAAIDLVGDVTDIL
jgi:hypothetical protein